MKKIGIVYMLVVILIYIIFPNDLFEEKALKKEGWPLPEFEKYKKRGCQKLYIEDVSQEFLVNNYSLKEKYNDELFQIETKLTPKSELRKYRLSNYSAITVIYENRTQIIAYEYSLFEFSLPLCL